MIFPCLPERDQGALQSVGGLLGLGQHLRDIHQGARLWSVASRVPGLLRSIDERVEFTAGIYEVSGRRRRGIGPRLAATSSRRSVERSRQPRQLAFGGSDAAAKHCEARGRWPVAEFCPSAFDDLEPPLNSPVSREQCVSAAPDVPVNLAVHRSSRPTVPARGARLHRVLQLSRMTT